MVDEVKTLGSITIRQRPPESYKGFTVSKKRSFGKVITFQITDDKVDIRLGYTIFFTGERDIRTLEIQKEYNTFDRLKHGLRLSILPHPYKPQKFYAELKRAYSKDLFNKYETLHPTTSELDLDQGAGLPVFTELIKAGAEVGTKHELLEDTGKSSPYLCAVFSEENLWVPIIIYVVTRILPIAKSYAGS